jgi:Ca2+-binding EF-hand superfamily protein
MGQSWNKYVDHFEPNPNVLGADKYTLRLLQELEFTSDEVDSLYTGTGGVSEIYLMNYVLYFLCIMSSAFCDIDSDVSGVIRLDELLTYFKIPKTLLSEKIFEDKESKYPNFLNFEQFAVYTWQFLTVSLDKLPAFAFHLIDAKNTGSLSHESIKYVVELIHNKPIEDCEVVRKMVKKIEAAHGVKHVSLTEFEALSDRNRALCDPLRRCQIAFQSKLLGRVNWKRLRLVRESSTDGYGVSENPAEKVLKKFRVDRRLNSSVIELDKRREDLETKLEIMLQEEPMIDEVATKREIKLADNDYSDRIVMPLDGVVRPPKSSSLRKSPRLIPASTEIPKKGKKKKRSFGRRSSSLNESSKGGKKRRHSMDDGPSSPAAAMLKDINNVTIFKSSSLDRYDDEEEKCTIKNEETEEAIEVSKKSNMKDASVIPF